MRIEYWTPAGEKVGERKIKERKIDEMTAEVDILDVFAALSAPFCPAKTENRKEEEK